jgi:hypothetical protein
MQKYVCSLLALLSSACAWGSAPAPLDACARFPFAHSALPTSGGDDGFTVLKKVCYVDASGSHVLHLLVDKGNAARKPQLSRAVQVRLMKLGDGARLESMARDASAADEAGVAFLPEFLDVGDIDGDGLIDPIVVYRFYALDGGRPDRDAFAGRIKLITFYKGQKVAIRAVTGTLDEARSTTASPNFFTLPKKVQGHLVKKMQQMYDDGQFGFDNSFGFRPRRE